MRRASQLIITSVKELKDVLVRDVFKNTHLDCSRTFYMIIYAREICSISDNGGPSSSVPPAAAAVSDEEASSPSTSNNSMIDTKHK
jgi:hypothetical protein